MLFVDDADRALELLVMHAEFAADHLDVRRHLAALRRVKRIRRAVVPDEPAAGLDPIQQFRLAVRSYRGLLVRAFDCEVRGRVEDDDLVLLQVLRIDKARVLCKKQIDAQIAR